MPVSVRMYGLCECWCGQTMRAMRAVRPNLLNGLASLAFELESGTAARTGLESDESSGFMSTFRLFVGDRARRMGPC